MATQHRITRRWALLLLVLGAACGGGTETYSPALSPGPVLVVERFLQAANASDLETMMQLFGTAEQTIDQLDGRGKAERRMHVLASLLRHDDFTILSQEALPGRMNTATTLEVRLHQGDRATVVPMVVVRRNAGGWIVEQVDIEALTGD